MFAWIKRIKEKRQKEREEIQARKQRLLELDEEIARKKIEIEESHKRLESIGEEIDTILKEKQSRESLEEYPYQSGSDYPC